MRSFVLRLHQLDDGFVKVSQTLRTAQPQSACTMDLIFSYILVVYRTLVLSGAAKSIEDVSTSCANMQARQAAKLSSV